MSYYDLSLSILLGRTELQICLEGQVVGGIWQFYTVSHAFCNDKPEDCSKLLPAPPVPFLHQAYPP